MEKNTKDAKVTTKVTNELPKAKKFVLPPMTEAFKAMPDNKKVVWIKGDFKLKSVVLARLAKGLDLYLLKNQALFVQES